MSDRNRRTIPKRQIKVQKKTRSTRSKAQDAEWERVMTNSTTPSGKPFLPETRYRLSSNRSLQLKAQGRIFSRHSRDFRPGKRRLPLTGDGCDLLCSLARHHRKSRHGRGHVMKVGIVGAGAVGAACAMAT